MVNAQRSCHLQRSHHAPGRARQDRVHGVRSRVLRVRHAAARLHDPKVGKAFLEGCFIKTPKVPLHDGRDVGVERRGAGPFVLAVLGQDVTGGRDKVALLSQSSSDSPFVVGIGVAMQQDHRDRLDSRLGKSRKERCHRALVQGRYDLAAGPEALPHFKRELPGNQGRRGLGHQVVKLPPVLPADQEEIPEALRDHQGSPGAPALEDGVGGHGRAVDEAHPRRREALRG